MRLPSSHTYKFPLPLRLPPPKFFLLTTHSALSRVPLVSCGIQTQISYQASSRSRDFVHQRYVSISFFLLQSSPTYSFPHLASAVCSILVGRSSETNCFCPAASIPIADPPVLSFSSCLRVAIISVSRRSPASARSFLSYPPQSASSLRLPFSSAGTTLRACRPRFLACLSSAGRFFSLGICLPLSFKPNFSLPYHSLPVFQPPAHPRYLKASIPSALPSIFCSRFVASASCHPASLVPRGFPSGLPASIHLPGFLPAATRPFPRPSPPIFLRFLRRSIGGRSLPAGCLPFLFSPPSLPSRLSRDFFHVHFQVPTP